MRAVSRNGAVALLLATTACANTTPNTATHIEPKPSASNISERAEAGQNAVQGSQYVSVDADAPEIAISAVFDSYQQVAGAPVQYVPTQETERVTLSASSSRFEAVDLPSRTAEPSDQNQTQSDAPVQIAALKAAEADTVEQSRTSLLRWRKSKVEIAPTRVPGPIKSESRVSTPAPTATPMAVLRTQQKKAVQAPERRSSSTRITWSSPAQVTRAPRVASKLPRIGKPSLLAAPQISNAPSISARSLEAAPTRPNTARVARLARPAAPPVEAAPKIADLTAAPRVSTAPVTATARPGKLGSPAVPKFTLPSFLRRAPTPAAPAVPKLEALGRVAAPQAASPQYVQVEVPEPAAPQYVETQLAAVQPAALPQTQPSYVSIDLAPQALPAPQYVQAQPRYVQMQPTPSTQPQYTSVAAPQLYVPTAPLVAQLQVGPARVAALTPTQTAALAPTVGAATSSRGTMRPIYDVPNTVVGDRGETQIHARKQFRPDLIRSANAPPARVRNQYSEGFGRVLERAALKRLNPRIRYDARYLKIGYPWGDVPGGTGVCSDVIIRSYRTLGVDLQQLVHEDMRQAFRAYPSQRIYGLRSADPNIDHRRVVNLEAFFERVGASVPVGRGPNDFKAGDVVTWRLNGSEPHIGIVVEERDPRTGYPMVVHNLGAGVRKEDMISIQQPVGQYRFAPQGAGAGQLISGLVGGIQGG